MWIKHQVCLLEVVKSRFIYLHTYFQLHHSVETSPGHLHRARTFFVRAWPQKWCKSRSFVNINDTTRCLSLQSRDAISDTQQAVASRCACWSALGGRSVMDSTFRYDGHTSSVPGRGSESDLGEGSEGCSQCLGWMLVRDDRSTVLRDCVWDFRLRILFCRSQETAWTFCLHSASKCECGLDQRSYLTHGRRRWYWIFGSSFNN